MILSVPGGEGRAGKEGKGSAEKGEIEGKPIVLCGENAQRGGPVFPFEERIPRSCGGRGTFLSSRKFPRGNRAGKDV